MGTLNLERLFDPKSIAIIGASDQEGTVGLALTKNLTQGEYTGKVYLVNNHRTEVLGLKAYPAIGAVPEPVDLVLIATPAKTVPAVMEECGRAGAKVAVILSAGFKEVGPSGKALEDQVLEIGRRYEIRVVGPNCLGIARPSLHLNATFLGRIPKPGNVAFLSQSGALGSAILDVAIHENVGFSAFASVGSMIDVDFGDLIDYFGGDPSTRSILMYVEGVTDARKFMSAARHFARTKPIVVVKAGRFNESARAVASHTGSLSGEDQVYEAAFKRAGIVRVEEIGDLFNAAEVLSTQPLPKGPNLAVITNAGGPGIMTADAIIAQGGKLAALSPKTMEILNASMPPHWSRGNPIDVIGDAGPERYRVALEACFNDESVDGVILLMTQQAIVKPIVIAKTIVDVVHEKSFLNKTVLSSFIGRTDMEEARSLLHANNIPTYSTPEETVRTYMTMYQYKRNIELLYQTPEELPVHAAPPKRPISALIQRVAAEGREILTEEEAKRLLKYYDFPVIPTVMATTADEAAASARSMGFPVVLKILSPDIPHKTDAGGVILDIGSEAEVRRDFEEILSRAKAYKANARISGVTVQPMIRQRGHEIIIGAKTDPLFGPIILFGMGGVGVELFRDAAVGMPPLNTTLIRRMVEETKIYQLLKGYRGQPGGNLEILERTMLLFSQLLVDFPQIKEIDINPLLINEENVNILDARVVIDKNLALQAHEPHAHLVISPYPRKYETRWTLKTGDEVLLRPIKPEDEPLWLEMFRGFSEESIRYRFFQMIKNTPHEMRVRYCNIDYDREIAIVAEMTKDGRRRLLGVCRISLEPNGKAGELAIILADDVQRLGLGTKMVDWALEVADDMGVERVYSVMLGDNFRAQGLMRKMGFHLKVQEGGEVHATVDLRSGEAAVPPKPAPSANPRETPSAEPPVRPSPPAGPAAASVASPK